LATSTGVQSRRIYRPRIGIALGAGSARGWAHIGVLQTLKKAGMAPDVVSGTSIGALVGAVYADDRLDELEEWVSSLTWRRVVGFFDVAFSSGLLKGGKLFTFLRAGLLDKNIEQLKRPFATVATDLGNGREVWFRSGSVADAVRASIATPGLFTPWRQDDRLLVDGALVNPVPVSLVRAMEAEFVIAVDLNAHLAGRQTRAPRGKPIKGPSMMEVMSGSINIMSARINRSRMAGEPAEAVIQPRLAEMGLMEYHRGGEAIAAGRAAAEQAVPQIRRLLQEFG
jgi:NTE family protein